MDRRVKTLAIFLGLSFALEPTQRTFDEYVASCITDCIGLSFSNKSCTANYKTGGFTDEDCTAYNTFQPTLISADQKVMLCDFNPNKDFGANIMTAVEHNLCTHVAFGPWHVFNSEQLKFEPIRSVMKKQLPAKEYSKVHGVKAILTFGSEYAENGMDAGNWSIVAADADWRKQIITQMVELMDVNKFDGISVFWHYSVCPNSDCSAGNRKDKENLVTLMRELYNVTKPQGKLLFLLLPHVDLPLAQGYDLPILWNVVDFFFLHSYLYEGIFNDFLGYPSSLNKMRLSMVTIRKNLGFSKMRKFLAGFSSVSTLYTLAKPNPKPKYKDESYISSYTSIVEVCESVKRGNFTFILNENDGNFAHNKTHVYAYEDYNSLKEKIEFFQSIGMGGLMYARSRDDDVENKCGCGPMPILRIASEILHGRGCLIKQCL
ncbi:Hypothetical predicted protein [Cloeon dipterum]|uniref:GH18 domain-containing protein n=1 Tax=Cloeon dipterum TaxID=197152 RepID=A0A8S1DF70_9INSE|nr:Hypothetical predicted protein [Cloeon dipterum]